MKLIFGIHDKPKLPQLIVFAIQQLLAIMAATLVVPVIIEGETGLPLSPAAALFGAGCGTLVYILFTKGKSPVFLGSSFAFINSMIAAVAGAATAGLGYLGLVLGAIMAGLVYVVIAVIVKFAGVNWLNKLMPTVVIGPTVAIIGLSLAGNAVGDTQLGEVVNAEGAAVASPLICILIAVITLIATTVASTYGKKMAKLIPFIIGIGCGYAVAVIFTVIGNIAGIDALKVIDFGYFSALLTDGKVTLATFFSVPQFVGFKALGSFSEINGAYIGTLVAAYVPVAFVVFAEHIADHKNISSIIEKDLLEDPGLSRTLLGDGVGSMVGAFFGACPNTTYGESVACVAITGNASVATIIATAVGAILISFLSPFVAIVDSIPPCVMGGVCIALYGFIAVSGLKMIQKVDLEENRNLFVVSTILICGIGGLTLNFGQVTITSIATALVLGIIVNLVLGKKAKEN
ncbi:MAG: uracil-xanthine permease [Oscillospiraceae bacterium]|nr:uracil-xanthine permease [Oscillospiraceae bacterium]